MYNGLGEETSNLCNREVVRHSSCCSSYTTIPEIPVIKRSISVYGRHLIYPLIGPMLLKCQLVRSDFLLVNNLITAEAKSHKTCFVSYYHQIKFEAQSPKCDE